MMIQAAQNRTRASRTRGGFTLIEALMAFLVLTMVIAGVCYGYVQANRIAMWCSMSQAAQSYAIQGMEQARAAKWNPWAYTTNNPNPQDQMPAPFTTNQQDYLDIPIKGTPYSGSSTNFAFFATNCITVTTVQSTPPLRQIESVVFWTFPITGKQFSNTVVTFRASDQ